MASSSVCRQTTAFEIHTKGHNVPTTQEGGGVTLLYKHQHHQRFLTFLL